MTTFFNTVTSTFVDSTPKGIFIDGITILVVILLLLFLIAKVFIDAYGNKSEFKIHTFAIVVFAFLLVLVKVGFLRIGQILHIF